MFEKIHAHLVSFCSVIAERPEGVAFLRATKDLYQLASINYVCINISVAKRPSNFTHCAYSDRFVKQFMSIHPIQLDLKDRNTFASPVVEDAKKIEANEYSPEHIKLVLNQRRGETAFFGIISGLEANQRMGRHDAMLRECRILANYFHGHVLRMNGYDSDQELLISARELDCLKWTAAGKTASEASTILGISERTVRFHLNAAREKLDCVTTTQAVAKAIANQLIDV
jgi:DNA-binding CsgD family transcriptional regulator